MDQVIEWLPSVDFSFYIAFICIVWLFSIFKSLTLSEKFIAFIVVIYFSNDVVSSLMAFHNMNNLWFYNLILFPQFLSVVLLLSLNVESRGTRRLMLFGGICFPVLHAANILLYQGLSNFSTFTYIPSTLWIATCSFLYLREQVEKTDADPFRQLLTWFALASLIDNAGTLPIISILGWTDYIKTEYATKLWDVVVILYTAWYLIILTGLLWTKTSLRSVLPSR